MTIASPVGTVTDYPFTYTGSSATFTVPRHDGLLYIAVFGGQGAPLTGTGAGGYGGRIDCTVDLPAGTHLTVIVGGAGAAGSGETGGAGGGPATGGYSGGAGGDVTFDFNNTPGPGGGAASAVLLGSDVLIVAGGGGGAKDTLRQAQLAGGNGIAAGSSTWTGTGDGDGSAGTLTAAGVAGIGSGFGSLNGNPGSGHVGGAGGVGTFIGGAGGGGGYYGGGGGGANPGGGVGSGGGGSSWADEDVCITVGESTGTPTGNGSVTITLDLLASIGWVAGKSLHGSGGGWI